MKFSDGCQNKGKRVRMILLSSWDILLLNPFWKQTATRKKARKLSLFQLSLYFFFFLINFPLKFGLFLFSAFLGCLKICFCNILSKSTASLCHNWEVLVYKDVISVSQIHHTTSKCLIVTFSICHCCLIFSEESMSFIQIRGKNEWKWKNYFHPIAAEVLHALSWSLGHVQDRIKGGNIICVGYSEQKTAYFNQRFCYCWIIQILQHQDALEIHFMLPSYLQREINNIQKKHQMFHFIILSIKSLRILIRNCFLFCNYF